MRTIALVLSYLALAGHGTRLKTSSAQMRDEAHEEDQGSQNVGKTMFSSHSLAELTHLQATQWNVVKMVPSAVNNPKQAADLLGARGGASNTRFRTNAVKTDIETDWKAEPEDWKIPDYASEFDSESYPASGADYSSPSWAGSWSDKSEALKAWSAARTLTYLLGFKLLDADGCGSISANDVRTFLDGTGVEYTDAEVDGMINQADVDGDGAIDYQEFVKMMMSVKDSWTAASTLSAMLGFKVFDQDASGYISGDEIRRVLSSMGEELSDTEVEEMIKQADADGNGLIDYDEFTRMMMRAYDYGVSQTSKSTYE